MAQRQITSFFGAPKSKSKDLSDDGSRADGCIASKSEEEIEKAEESPVKKTAYKRVRKITDSDEENGRESKSDTSPSPEKDSGKQSRKKTKGINSSKSTSEPEKVEVEDMSMMEEDKEEGITSGSDSEKPTANDAKNTKPIDSFFTPKKISKSKKVASGKPKEKKTTKKITKPKEEDLEDKKENTKPITPLTYTPNISKYHPIDHACWKKGERVPYLALSKTLEEIENISARLKMIEILSNFLRSVLVLTPEDLVHCIYLCLNRLAPAYEGIELGIGDMIMMKALAQATGRTVDKIKAEVSIKGDLGLVAESSRSNQRTMFQPAPLTVQAVFTKLTEIAKMSGHSSMNKKTEKIQGMLVACRMSEARFLVRSLGGKLRIGLAEQSILAAIAQAAVMTPPEQAYPPEILDSSKGMSTDAFKKKLDAETLILKTTYCECPNFDKIIEVLLQEGIGGLEKQCKLTPGIPLKPMLAHPTKGIHEVLQRFENARFTCEFKYDGERAQIHFIDGNVHIYSRNQENNTSKYPDIIARIPKTLKEETASWIIDSEAVAWDTETKQILPFQILSTRKKKDADKSEIKVQVCVFAFDLLYLNGESLVRKSFEERRDLLRKSFNEIEGEFMFAKSVDSSNTEEIGEFLEISVKGNCEGLMVKTLNVDATYEIAKRSHNWLKLKKDYLEGVGDTLDLVVIGGYHGKGKRTGSYGGFLLACYDDENEEFQSICKLGTGFTDEALEQHSKFFKDHVIDKPKPYYRFDNSVLPNIWFDNVQVWEVKCADLSISPVHKAAVGIVDQEKGISLRFPRFISIREDKSPEDATSSSQVAELYRNQDQVKNQKSADSKQEEEDYY